VPPRQLDADSIGNPPPRPRLFPDIALPTSCPRHTPHGRRASTFSRHMNPSRQHTSRARRDLEPMPCEPGHGSPCSFFCNHSTAVPRHSRPPKPRCHHAHADAHALECGFQAAVTHARGSVSMSVPASSQAPPKVNLAIAAAIMSPGTVSLLPLGATVPLAEAATGTPSSVHRP
jgi:hypothetical protein